MRKTFWSLLSAGLAVTAFAGFSLDNQEAQAGMFSGAAAPCDGCVQVSAVDYDDDCDD